MPREPKRFRVRVRGMGLFAKINLAIVLTMTTVLILVTLLLINFSVKPSLEKDRLLNEEANARLLDVVSAKYELLYNQSNLILSSGHVGGMLAMAQSTRDYLFEYANIKFIVDYLNTLLYSDADMADAAILTLDGSINFARSADTGRTLSASFPYTDLPAVRTLLEGEDNLRIYYDPSPAYARPAAVPMVTFLSKIYNPLLLPRKAPIGVLLINYPLSVFDDAYQQLGGLSGGEVYVVNSASEIVFSNDAPLLGTIFDPDALPGAEYSRHPVGLSGLEVIGVLPADILRSATDTLILTTLRIVTPAIVLVLLVVLILNRRYQKKINLLADAMEHAAEGGLHVRLPVAQQDEIGRLSLHFNRMCESLDAYIKLHYEAEVARRTAELDALQAQINPHFLFNTIESIRMCALEAADLDVANMLMKLGNLLRWLILMDRQIVYLEDEVEYCESYLSLQRLRYQDSFESDIDADSEALYLGVPKFTLQPVVENALQHGLQENGLSGRIAIAARAAAGTLRLTVSDNGSGMPPDRLDRLVRHIHGEENDPQFGIGLKNVHARVRMLFGAPYGLEVESAPQRGTTVTITLPAIPKKEMEHSVSDDYRR